MDMYTYMYSIINRKKWETWYVEKENRTNESTLIIMLYLCVLIFLIMN